MAVFCFLKHYIGSFINNYSDGSEHQIKHHPIFLSFITKFGDIIAGSLNIFTYFRLKSSKHQTIQDNSIQRFAKVENIPTYESHSDATAKVMVLLFMLSVLEITMLLCFFILNNYSNLSFSLTMIITLIIFEAIISAPMLKYKIDRHQKVSLILISIGFVLVSIPQVITSFESDLPEYSLIFYPIYFWVYIIFAFLDVMQKWVMENKLYTPYQLVFTSRNISCGIFAILFMILPYCECKWDFCSYNPLNTLMIEPLVSTFKLYFSTDKIIRSVMFVLYELICAGYIMLFFITIYHFTPTQRSVSDSLASFIYWIIQLETQDAFESLILSLIGYLLVLFSCLIYNEIIILYFFRLEYYTKKEIDKR